MTLISRLTTWSLMDTGDPLQASLAVLDASWEPVMHRTLPCGPFTPLDEVVAELRADQRAWLATYGVQLELI